MLAVSLQSHGDFGDQLVAQHLVGVDDQHPVVLSGRNGEVFLTAETGELVVQHPAIELTTYFERPIATPRVDHQELIAPGECRQGLCERCF